MKSQSEIDAAQASNAEKWLALPSDQKSAMAAEWWTHFDWLLSHARDWGFRLKVEFYTPDGAGSGWSVGRKLKARHL